MPTETIGVIGLGLLGSALSQRLISAGFRVAGFDIGSDRVREAERIGVTPATSPADVASVARRTVLSLPDSDVVDEVVEGEHGLLESLRTGDLIIDTTTADPVRTEALARRLSEKGVGFVDATVLGSSKQARSGDVLIMAGGSDVDMERSRDILNAFTDRVFHMGPCGKGAQTKLIANLVLGLNRLVLAEALVLGRRAGVNLDTLLSVLQGGAASSRVMDTKGRKMIDGDFAPEARLAQHLKDVGLILELGEQTATPLPLSDLHADLLRSGVEEGFGELDNSAIMAVLESLTSSKDG
jgi:3-hydroxyisobutyrate dehydrogenase-like beta-hydroxyacid dehydrogenase